MKIEIGKNYKTRDGEIATVVAITDDPMPVEVQIAGRPFKNVLTATGCAWEEGMDAPDDLVELAN